MHPGDEGRITHLGRQGERELRRLRGPRMGAHVHVRGNDARVEEQQRVRVVHPRAVEFVEGGLEQITGVAEFTGEVVGHGPAAQGGHPVRQGCVAEALFRGLETFPRGLQVPGLQGAFAEPEQRRGLLGDEPVRVRLREQRVVLLRRDLRLAGGERALGVGEPQPQIGGEVGGAPGRDLLVRHPEPLGDVPQRGLGGPHPPGLQGGDVRGRVRRFRQLLLRQSAFRTQLLNPAPDDLRAVTLRHGLSMPLTRVTLGQLLTIVQLPLRPLPFDALNPYVKRRIKPA